MTPIKTDYGRQEVILDKRQSEEVIYFPEGVRVNENWDVEQPFNVGK